MESSTFLWRYSVSGLWYRKKAGVHKMVMDLGPNGKHIAGCHVRFRHEDISAAGGTELCGPAASISYFGRIYNSR